MGVKYLWPGGGEMFAESAKYWERSGESGMVFRLFQANSGAETSKVGCKSSAPHHGRLMPTGLA